MKQKNNSFRFPFYVVKRMDMSKKKIWIIKIIGILLAFLFSGIICNIFKPGSFTTYFQEMLRGCFDLEDFTTFIDLLAAISILLLISLALLPAFKMRFWNIGAEGQILIGCLTSAGIARFASSEMPDALVLILCLVCSIVASVIWTIIPAIFKAFFNTNETLFTLMMNYIAAVLVELFISLWVKNGSQTFGVLADNRVLPDLFEIEFIPVILTAVIVTAFMFFYLKKSKQGYELSVVGESINTARYVGINVKKVIIRTMIVGGIISGILGFLIVCGYNHTLSSTIVGGKGFTGVLIAWLGHFNPLEILLYSSLVGIFERGTTCAATAINMSATQFSAIVTGVFFFIIIACEFFTNYQIKEHHTDKESEDK